MLEVKDISRKMYQTPSNRANGVTFRKIMLALKDASGGKQVLYIVPSLKNHGVHVKDKINCILMGYFGGSVERSRQQNLYVFPYGGTLRVISKRNFEDILPRTRSDERNTVIWDFT